MAEVPANFEMKLSGRGILRPGLKPWVAAETARHAGANRVMRLRASLAASGAPRRRLQVDAARSLFRDPFARHELPPSRTNDSPKLPTVCACCEQRAHEQVHADRGIRLLHLGNARLARADAAGKFGLRPVVFLPQLTDPAREGQFDLHELRLTGSELQIVLRVAYPPTGYSRASVASRPTSRVRPVLIGAASPLTYAAEMHHLAEPEELRRVADRLHAIAAALPDLVMVVDEDGRYVELLSGQQELLYRSPDDLKGKRFEEIFEADIAREFISVIRRTIDSGQPQVIEYSLDVPAGQRWFEGRSSPLALEIDGRRCIVFIARDITAKKRAEELETQNVYLREELATELHTEMIGASQAMKRILADISLVASTDSTVLLLGETGTGKELIARAIHKASARAAEVMVKVNCGALPATLAESELFGHERGAFTGALQQKKGRFELAHRGSIFLDEVGELPPEIQVKLLRVLQEQEIERVGGTRTMRVDIRVIAATNRDLQKEVENGAFRADLFYRLNVFPIVVPPLRERKDDIPLLARHFVRDFSRRMGRQVQEIEGRAIVRLVEYDWPGNVRELANVLERAVILCRGTVLKAEHVGTLRSEANVVGSFLTLREMERFHILEALERSGGVIAGPRGAAKFLGVKRSTLWSRMQKLGIHPSSR